MAIFGNVETIRKQIKDDKFIVAFEYLVKVLENGSEENKRLFSYAVNECKKITLDDDSFVLEQVYITKDRDECFFESHRKYIDIQFILDGEEIIEVENILNLEIKVKYDENLDLIKYQDYHFGSKIRLKAGDAVILFPEDAHMPSIKTENNSKVYKIVIKLLNE